MVVLICLLRDGDRESPSNNGQGSKRLTSAPDRIDERSNPRLPKTKRISAILPGDWTRKQESEDQWRQMRIALGYYDLGLYENAETILAKLETTSNRSIALQRDSVRLRIEEQRTKAAQEEFEHMFIENVVFSEALSAITVVEDEPATSNEASR